MEQDDIKDGKNNGVAIAKGLTIILMVFGHTSCFEYANNYLLLMRMPLFFLMSGYCFKVKYLTNGSKYLKRRVTGIYLPYVKWALVFLCLHNFFLYINFYSPELLIHGKTMSRYEWHDFLMYGTAIILGMRGHETLLGGYWFLHDLFLGSLLFYFGLKLFKSRHLAAIIWFTIAVIFSFAGSFFENLINSHLFLAVFFITIGHCYRMDELRWAKEFWYIVSTAIAVFFVSLIWHSSMTTYVGWEVFPYSVCAVTGALMLFGIGEKISMHVGVLRNFLSYTGSKTFNILTWHLVSLKIVSVIIILLYSLPIQQLAVFPIMKDFASMGWWIAYFVVGVGLPLIMSYYYDRIKLHMR